MNRVRKQQPLVGTHQSGAHGIEVDSNGQVGSSSRAGETGKMSFFSERPFKQRRFPVLIAGEWSCAEGYSWANAGHGILLSYSWAHDKVEQTFNRIHRLDSPKDVNIHPIICDDSIVWRARLCRGPWVRKWCDPGPLGLIRDCVRLGRAYSCWRRRVRYA